MKIIGYIKFSIILFTLHLKKVTKYDYKKIYICIY